MTDAGKHLAEEVDYGLGSLMETVTGYGSADPVIKQPALLADNGDVVQPAGSVYVSRLWHDARLGSGSDADLGAYRAIDKTAGSYAGNEPPYDTTEYPAHGNAYGGKDWPYDFTAEDGSSVIPLPDPSPSPEPTPSGDYVTLQIGSNYYTIPTGAKVVLPATGGPWTDANGTAYQNGQIIVVVSDMVLSAGA